MRAQVATLSADDTSTVAVTMRAAGMQHREWLHLNEQRVKMRRIWCAFFADFDVLLCPIFGRAAPPRMEEGVRWERRVQVGQAQLLTMSFCSGRELAAAFICPVPSCRSRAAGRACRSVSRSLRAHTVTARQLRRPVSSKPCKEASSRHPAGADAPMRRIFGACPMTPRCNDHSQHPGGICRSIQSRDCFCSAGPYSSSRARMTDNDKLIYTGEMR